MALFDDILLDVYALTNRPDLIDESKLGIRVATVKLHTVEFWREDRVEEEIAVVTASSQFSVEIIVGTESSDTFSYQPRPNNIVFKKPNTTTVFEEINPKQLLDGFGFQKYNVYYRAGNSYHFLTDSGDTSVIASYYRLPVATETGYDSWIATLYQHYVAVEAALFVANATGNKELEARMQAMAALNLAQLNIAHLDSN